MEEEEKAEEAAGARITKKKKTKGKQGRQAKLTGGTTDSGNSLKETRPSPFAEVIDPIIPEFCAEKKKPVGRGRGKVKSEPKTDKSADKEDPKQKRLKFEDDTDTKEVPAEKPTKAGATHGKKRKVKELLDSFVIGSSSESEEEEGDVEKKTLKERIELRKTKTADYKEVLSGDNEESVVSVESEGSWKSGSDVDVNTPPPIKKIKTATTEVLQKKDHKPTKAVGKKKKPTTKPPLVTKSATVTTKPAVSKKVGSSSSSGSSGEKKKTVLGKKSRRVVSSHDLCSDDETDYSIDSGSGSDSITIPAKKKAATEVCTSYHQVELES